MSVTELAEIWGWQYFDMLPLGYFLMPKIGGTMQELTIEEIACVDGGGRVGAAAAAAGAAFVGLWVAAFDVGYAIGKDVGHAIFD